MPESISHEGYSAKPMHSYWDNFFALLGLRALFVLVEGLVRRFRYLNQTVAIVLGVAIGTLVSLPVVAQIGLSLVAAFIIISMVWNRLVMFGTSGTARVPTLWIVLGPLGQSITAAGLLGLNAGLAVDPAVAQSMNVFAVLFGVPVWGFAVLWIALATLLTVRTLRNGMPFALTWWSLTFPVGTYVTGTTQLAVHTDLPAFKVAAVIAYAGLLSTWLLVAVRTARGSLRGNLLQPPPSAGPVRARKDPVP